MDKIAVLIPCYNEAKTIKKVIEDYKTNLPDATIYVYDNNSTDGTDEIAKEVGAIVRHVPNQGKGNVIKKMFREIDANCYILTDGDDTYPANRAKEMANHVLNENIDMVIGDRLSSTYFTENKRPFHGFGNVLVKFLINIIYKSKVRDVLTGFRAFSYEFVKTFPVLSKGFEVDTEMTIHALDKNLSTKNVIIEYKDRPEGSKSKLKTYSDGFKVLKTVFSLYKNYRPLSFFVWLTLFFSIIGTIFLIPVLVEYFKTGLVEKFPTFIASVFFYIVSMQAFSCRINIR